MSTAFAPSLTMLIELTCDPAQQAEFISILSENLEASRNAEGNLQFDILLDPDKPSKVYFFERWASAEDQQQYMKWREDNSDRALLDKYLTEPPAATLYQTVE